MPNAVAAINKMLSTGKKVMGLKGWTDIAVSIKTCNKTTKRTIYVPVQVTTVKLIKNTITLAVALQFDHHMPESESSKELLITPDNLYLSIDDIESLLKEEAIREKYNSEISELNSIHRRATYRRDKFKDLYDRATEQARQIVDREIAENSWTFPKIPLSELHDLAETLAKSIYYPNTPDAEIEDEEDDWD
jgi:hypothetical protein